MASTPNVGLPQGAPVCTVITPSVSITPPLRPPLQSLDFWKYKLACDFFTTIFSIERFPQLLEPRIRSPFSLSSVRSITEFPEYTHNPKFLTTHVASA